MIYSTNGSGTGSLPVARALASYFKYNKGMEIARKLVYTEAEWFALIKNELDDNPSHLENTLSGNNSMHTAIKANCLLLPIKKLTLRYSA